MFLLSQRADKAEALAKSTLEVLQSYEKAVGDKRSLESTVHAERQQGDFMRERLTELQRALLALHNPKIEATVVGQTNRGKEPAEVPFVPRQARWAAAGMGIVPNVDPLGGYSSTTFKGPSDLAGLARRESGPTILPQADGDGA